SIVPSDESRGYDRLALRASADSVPQRLTTEITLALNARPKAHPPASQEYFRPFSGLRSTAAEQIPRILFVSWKKRSLTTDSRDDRIGWRIDCDRGQRRIHRSFDFVEKLSFAELFDSAQDDKI